MADNNNYEPAADDEPPTLGQTQQWTEVAPELYKLTTKMELLLDGLKDSMKSQTKHALEKEMLQGKINRLNKKLKAAMEEIEDWRRCYTDMEKSMHRLKEAKQKVTKEKQKLVKENKALAAENKELTEKNQTVSETLNKLLHKCVDLDRENKRLREANPPVQPTQMQLAPL